MKKHCLHSMGLAVVAAVTAIAFVSCNKSDDPAVPEVSLVPANSHIISAPGAYSFQAVKGNSSESVGAVASAEVLWESFGTAETPAKGSVVAGASYAASDGLIHFKTPAELKDGNALIAAKDASGNILWSWHIWVCDGWDPAKTAHTYYNGAGVMMDRNLGATSATPGDIRSHGLLYQWGRKDPFLGSSSELEKVEAASTLQWPETVLSTPETGTIAYSIAHPTTFIGSIEDNYDWYYTGEFDSDNTRWQSEKTIYDPCPAGWTLPTGPTPTSDGFWYSVYRKYLLTVSWDGVLRGYNFAKVFGDADPIWFPLTGFRSDDDGRLWAVGNESGLWTSTTDMDATDPNAKIMAFTLDLSITTNGDIEVFTAKDCFRAIGYSVRCVAE